MLYRADWLARLMALLMLVTASLCAWPNLTSGDFTWPEPHVGADSPPNPLSYKENSAPKASGCVGYACFGQVANTEIGNIITDEQKANPGDPNWQENGSYSLILHGLVGLAQGAISGGGSAGSIIGGGAGAVAGTAITPILANYLSTHGISPTSAEGRTLLTLASSAIGAGVGAAAGGTGTAVAGSSAAANSTTYNYLNHAQLTKPEAAARALQGCEQVPGSCSQTTIDGDEATVQQAQVQSAENDQQLISDCSGGPSATCLGDISALQTFVETGSSPGSGAFEFSPTSGVTNVDVQLYSAYAGLLGSNPTETTAEAQQDFDQNLQSINSGVSIAAQIALGVIAPEGEAANIIADSIEDGIAAEEAGGALNFSQTTASPYFSSSGTFSGQSIANVASQLRSGALSASDVPVQTVNLGSGGLIVNTRSALSLMQAGIPQSEWSIIDMTGDAATESNIGARLINNGLTNAGTDVLRITGSGPHTSTLIP